MPRLAHHTTVSSSAPVVAEAPVQKQPERTFHAAGAADPGMRAVGDLGAPCALVAQLNGAGEVPVVRHRERPLLVGQPSRRASPRGRTAGVVARVRDRHRRSRPGSAGRGTARERPDVVLAVGAQRDHAVGQGRARRAGSAWSDPRNVRRARANGNRRGRWHVGPDVTSLALEQPTATTVTARHFALAVLALAMGGFAIGTTEFVTMGLLPADRRRRRRLDPDGRPRDLGVRRRRGRRCPGAGLLRRPVPAPRPAAGAGGVARDRQRDERPRRRATGC